jgi:hypothetical protein
LNPCFCYVTRFLLKEAIIQHSSCHGLTDLFWLLSTSTRNFWLKNFRAAFFIWMFEDFPHVIWHFKIFYSISHNLIDMVLVSHVSYTTECQSSNSFPFMLIYIDHNFLFKLEVHSSNTYLSEFMHGSSFVAIKIYFISKTGNVSILVCKLFIT